MTCFRKFTSFVGLCYLLISPAFGQWTEKNNGLYTGIVRSFAVLDNRLFAGTNGGIWVSSNEAVTWLPSGLPNYPIKSLAVEGTNLWAAAGASIFESTDNGITWQSRSSGLGGDDVLSLVASGSTLFAGTTNGVYRSIDGTNWVQMGLLGKYTNGFGEYGGKVYACTSTGVYISTNSGTDWTSLGINSISLCVLVSDTYILVGGSNGISLSTNNGSTWQDVSFQMTRALARVGNTIFAGTASSGVYVSTDNGVTWLPSDSGLTTKDVNAVTSIGSKIFAGTWGGAGLFVSTNNGASWAAANDGLASIEIPAIAAFGSKLFASIYTEGVYVTTNGESWVPANEGLANKYVSSVVANSDYVFAGTFGGGVFRSGDEGAHWSTVNNGLDNLDVLKVQIIDATLYASTYDGIFYSENNGTSWVPIGPSDKVVFSMTKSGSNLLAATNSMGVYVSGDNGANWTVASTSTSSWHSCFLNVGNQVLAATYGDGIFLSNDNGLSWSPEGVGISNLSITDLTPYHTNIFAATGVGVFMSDDNGANWANYSLNRDIRSLTVFQGYLFAGTYGQGMFARPLLSLTSFSPSIAMVDASVTITGTDFSTIPGNNTVSFNGVTANVTVSSATSLTVTVPVGATSGKISVTVDGKTAISANDFIVEDNTAPTLAGTMPVDNAISVPLASSLELTFTELIQKGTGNILIKEGGVTKQTIDVLSASVTVTGLVVTIDPANFTGGSSVYVELGAGVFKDLANNNYAGISDASTWNFGVEIVTGVDRNFPDFKVYPNPTTGTIRIESETVINETVGVYNLLGSKLISLNLSRGIDNQSGEFNLKDLPVGVYILVLKTSQMERHIRIQKY